jgi:hypothetical protein
MKAVGLALGVVAAAPAAMAQDNGCDRACLGEFEQRYFQSLISHNPEDLPVAADVRFTEDATELQPGEGLWATATGVRQHRLSVLDDLWDTVAGLAIMEEGDSMTLLAYRLKIEDGAVTEIETMVVRDSAESPFADRPALMSPREEFFVEVPEDQRETREEIIRIADHYPAGLKAGSFVEVDAPFAEGARRTENGTILAGPDCTFNENCRDMKTQPSPERPTLRQRLLAVDEVTGVAYYWLDWVQISTGNTLEVYEAFKVYDGQIHAVDAFIKTDDRERYPGWE